MIYFEIIINLLLGAISNRVKEILKIHYIYFIRDQEFIDYNRCKYILIIMSNILYAYICKTLLPLCLNDLQYALEDNNYNLLLTFRSHILSALRNVNGINIGPEINLILNDLYKF